VQHGFRGADREHEIRLEQSGVDAHVPSLDWKRDEVRRLGVVHLDRAAEAARERRRYELIDLALGSPPREAACNEDRRPLRGNP
jgi:hypothetical protein